MTDTPAPATDRPIFRDGLLDGQVAIITGSTACEQKKVPNRSISITERHALGERVSDGA